MRFPSGAVDLYLGNPKKGSLNDPDWVSAYHSKKQSGEMRDTDLIVRSYGTRSKKMFVTFVTIVTKYSL